MPALHSALENAPGRTDTGKMIQSVRPPFDYIQDEIEISKQQYRISRRDTSHYGYQRASVSRKVDNDTGFSASVALVPAVDDAAEVSLSKVYTVDTPRLSR